MRLPSPGQRPGNSSATNVLTQRKSASSLYRIELLTELIMRPTEQQANFRGRKGTSATRCSSILSATIALLLLVSISPKILAEGGAPPLIELKVASQLETGLPIAWQPREVLLLRTDGAIDRFEGQRIESHQLLSRGFVPETAIQVRGQLLREFGKRYAVEANGNFAIVAPPATVQQWQARFAQLHRAFEHYFRTRGYPLKPVEFPLVGIVFATQSEFLQNGQRLGLRMQEGTVGLYSPMTNRLYAYEADDEALQTLWHEAAHQLAFNSGLHQRLSSPPLWLVEGIASVFEAPGMMQPRSTLNPADLINRSRWEHWGQLSKNLDQTAQIFSAMILSDEVFRQAPAEAYAIAWGVSLYLAEREPSKFVPYLQKMASLSAGSEYAPGQRLKDFRQAYSGDTRLLINSADRYIKGLK
jgi:hypothetical protein